MQSDQGTPSDLALEIYFRSHHFCPLGHIHDTGVVQEIALAGMKNKSLTVIADKNRKRRFRN